MLYLLNSGGGARGGSIFVLCHCRWRSASLYSSISLARTSILASASIQSRNRKRSLWEIIDEMQCIIWKSQIGLLVQTRRTMRSCSRTRVYAKRLFAQGFKAVESILRVSMFFDVSSLRALHLRTTNSAASTFTRVQASISTSSAPSSATKHIRSSSTRLIDVTHVYFKVFQDSNTSNCSSQARIVPTDTVLPGSTSQAPLGITRAKRSLWTGFSPSHFHKSKTFQMCISSVA